MSEEKGLEKVELSDEKMETVTGGADSYEMYLDKWEPGCQCIVKCEDCGYEFRDSSGKDLTGKTDIICEICREPAGHVVSYFFLP